ncbi:transposase [Proteiniphilum sp.]|uniref:transposase n=1 Tax=Proteiniphilum sp. TaxID=1926877 RepID=UPI002B204E0B|nr:transposase [Proteiniphilum sp.]MEA4916577.1 transposase [Proteiniphilum sp.]
MRKIQQITEISQTLPLYQESELLSFYRSSFESSELGRLYRVFPFSAIAESFSLKTCKSGRKSFFSPEGKIALMVLKSYTGLSDRKLVEQINGSIHFQFFCGIFIRPGEEIRDTKLVSKVRCELASRLDMDSFQKEMAGAWKPLMKDLHVVMSDATCYESHLRYPTNEKLLWEAIEWIYGRIVTLSRELKMRRPRSKYDDIRKRYMNYTRSRRKTRKKRRKLRTSLIFLLEKLDRQLDAIESQYRGILVLDGFHHKRRNIIREVLSQQRQMHRSGESMPGRIVSIDKHYVRPIVRGKETKAVEFGAKANLIQVDGINFIEHVSFKPFNEGVRGISSIQYARLLFRKKVTHFAADAIYGTNRTRKYCSSSPSPIYTGFVRKGKKARDEDHRSKLRSLLSKERSTRLEGSFGTEKEHYNLRKVKARTEETEILWILFGVHTANAVRLAARGQRKEQRKPA